MQIANPIYDNVFKFLLEDMDIVRGLLSEILDTTVVSVETKPQELVSTLVVGEKSLTVFRLDFVCIIADATGNHKKVLIELQKAKNTEDIMRFRKYLAQNYEKKDTISTPAGTMEVPLEIITIYFLGFTFSDMSAPVTHIARRFHNASNKKAYTSNPQNDFVRLLSHESYIIQVPRLPKASKLRLERVLRVFALTQEQMKQHQIDFAESTEDPQVTQQISRRLSYAASSREMQQIMDLEDELERTLLKEHRSMQSRLAAAEQRAEIAREEKEAAQQQVELERTEKEAAQQQAEAERAEKEVAQKQAENAQQKILLAAKRMLAAGMSAQDVQDALGLTAADMQDLLA